MTQPAPTAPVSPAYLQTLFAYDAWASSRIFATAAALAPAALDATPLSGLGSLRSILVHLVSATWVWRTRLAGAMPTAMLDPADLASLAAIEARWAAEDAALRAILTDLAAEHIDDDVEVAVGPGREPLELGDGPTLQLLGSLG
jgi:uncharacterized damage-inducible protein DinB